MAEPPKRSLVRKLSEVMAAVERVSKNGRNDFHKYAYVTEADLADAIRGELASRQVFIFPSIRKCERSMLDVETLKWDDAARAKVPTIRKTQITEIEVEWTFVDGESDEERTIVVHGVGEDNVDKGFYKAFTGSEKYMLMKSFLIPTGDDPERETKEERRDSAKEGKSAAQEVGKAKVAALKEKMAQRAAQPEPEANAEPAVLFSVLIWRDTDNTANDVYEVSGHSDVMQAHAELLLAHGKKVTTGKGDSRKAVVHMNPERLSDFTFAFEERGGSIKALKPNA